MNFFYKICAPVVAEKGVGLGAEVRENRVVELGEVVFEVGAAHGFDGIFLGVGEGALGEGVDGAEDACKDAGGGADFLPGVQVGDFFVAGDASLVIIVVNGVRE